MKLRENLGLFDFMTLLFGGDVDNLLRALDALEPGVRDDGHSIFFAAVEGRGARLDEAIAPFVAGYDRRLRGYEERLRQRRGEFRLTGFQWLAAMYAEVYFHWLKRDRAGLRERLNTHYEVHFPLLAGLVDDDLGMVAFYLATGAGKTLLAHVNYWQLQHYKPVARGCSLFVTPNEALTKQHLEELTRSGIRCVNMTEHEDHSDVNVIEITKLYRSGENRTKRGGGVSIPTDEIERPVWMFVDEGHKGTSGGDDATERAWRAIRQDLGEGGITLEYSATFGQIAENDEELLKTYGRAVLFDYSYPRFWRDGYGKNFHVMNLGKGQNHRGDDLLMAGLLGFYEQRRYYDEHRPALAPYGVAEPLHIFVGAYVTRQRAEERVSDVGALLKFLDRVQTDRDWAIRTIAVLLGKQTDAGIEVLGRRYPTLGRNEKAASVYYTDLQARLFRGHGRIELRRLKKTDGEVGIRVVDASASTGSAEATYCGVVNVGDADGLVKHCAALGLKVGDEDPLTDSYFDRVNEPNSPVNFLVGSRKFLEGWSSWRVSSMGLMNIGKAAGAQIIQLFGRGVRLKGLGMSLKRSAMHRSDERPEELDHMPEVLETLRIYGVRSDYLEAFEKVVSLEGVDEVEVALPVTLAPAMQSVRLLLPTVADPEAFQREVVRFDADAVRACVRSADKLIDLLPKMTTAAPTPGSGTGGVKLTVSAVTFDGKEQALPSGVCDLEAAYQHALEYKRQRGWHHLWVERSGVEALAAKDVRVISTEHIAAAGPWKPELRRQLRAGLQVVLERAMKRVYYAAQQRHEMGALEALPLGAGHANLAFGAERGSEVGRFRIRVPRAKAKAITELVASVVAGHDNAALVPELPRFWWDAHLFQPLLMARPDEDEPALEVRPTALVKGEQAFVRHLKAWWDRVHGTPAWEGTSLYVLRNLPRSGVGFYENAGFYPDFLIWLVRGDRQVLGFVDPKGLVHWNEDKVSMLDFIERQSLPELPLRAAIATETPYDLIGSATMNFRKKSEAEYRALRIENQDDDGAYVERILTRFREALA